MTQPTRRPRRTGTWIVITILLAASLVATLWVPSYARATPAIGGFPFFYWYQLLWVPIVAILSAAAYFLSKRTGGETGTSAPGSAEKPGPGSGKVPS